MFSPALQLMFSMQPTFLSMQPTFLSWQLRNMPNLFVIIMADVNYSYKYFRNTSYYVNRRVTVKKG